MAWDAADLDSVLSSALGKPATVESFEIVPFSEQRRGIMSDHYSLVLSYKCPGSSPDRAKKSLKLFVKEPPVQEELRACLVDDFVTREEAYFFRSVYPLLLAECRAAKWSPTCLRASSRRLVFEDVRELGYSIRRDTMYDLASTKAALEALAGFHASSLRLETRLATRLDLRYRDELLREKVFTREGKGGRGNELGFETLRQLAEIRFGLDGSLVPRIHELVRRRVEPSQGLGSNVICHGDLWRGNVMFNDSAASGPKCLLVDFQMLRYGPPSLDLAMLLYVHSERSFREAHEAQLLGHYYAKLSEYFHDGNESAWKLFDYEHLVRDYEARKIVGMAYAAMRWPALVTSRLDDAEALRDWYFVSRIDGYIEQMDRDRAFERLMKSCVEEFIEQGKKLLEC